MARANSNSAARLCLVCVCGLILVLYSVPCAAQTDASLLFAPWDHHDSAENRTDALAFERTDISSSHSSTDFLEFHSSGRVRLDQSHGINPSIGYDWTHFDLSNAAPLLPNHLDDISIAAATPLGAWGDWFGAALLGVGYAGDDVVGTKGLYGKADLIAGRRLGNDNTLIFALDYDGSRTLLPDVPIPYLLYNDHVGKNFEFTFGFPLTSFQWRPTDRLSIWGDFSIPSSLQGGVEYKFTQHLFGYAKYVDQEDAFHTNDLPDDRRLFYHEDRVELGIRWPASDNFEFSVGAGYGFDRRFNTGFDDRNLTSVTKLSDEPFIRAAIKFAF